MNLGSCHEYVRGKSVGVGLYDGKDDADYRDESPKEYPKIHPRHSSGDALEVRESGEQVF